MPRRFKIDISARSVAVVGGAVVAVWLWLRLWQWVLLFAIAVLIAIGLAPVVSWLERRRIPRRYGAPLVVLAIVAALGVFSYLAASELIAQGELLGERLGQAQQAVRDRLPAWALNALPASKDGASPWGAYVVEFGRALTSGLFSLGIALVLALYLLLDGRRTYEWFVAFAPRRLRSRVRQTGADARTAIVAYVRGNVTTSALAAVATYIVLVALKVPAALLLAILAGIFDLVPVIGIVLTVVPSVLLALTVSTSAALGVVVFNIAYNVFENYYISPKVYGRALRVSDLAVIGSFAIGAELGGVMGALVALPIVAMYPSIESLWLADRLGPDVASDHRRVEGQQQH